MQLTAMPFWLFAGLAVLTAGVLAVLQYLRIRPQRVRVITTLFWQQAADQAQARTLLERFRHPRTYLLLLTVGLLLLAALAAPVFHAADEPHRVIVLEAGLAMTAADGRFDNALALVRAEAASLDEGRVAVMVADPRPRVLKHFDESLAALEDRLAKIEAVETPVIREDALRTAKSLLDGRQNGSAVLVAAGPVTIDDADVRVLAAGEIAQNAFLLSAVFVPDPTDPTRGAFHCRVGFTGKEADKITLKINRADETLLEQTAEFDPGEVKAFAVPDLAADGRLLTAAVAGPDAVSGDNRVDFPLPDRRRISVVPADGNELPPVLASVLESLAEVTGEATQGESGPVIRVGQAGTDAEILIQPSDGEGELTAVEVADHPLLEGLVFEDALCRAAGSPLSVSEDHVPLLFVGDSPVAGLNRDADQLTVAATLFDEDAGLVRRTGYLVFWSNMLHHLAGWRAEPLTLSPVQADRSTDTASTAVALNADMGNFAFTADGGAASVERGDTRPTVWQWLLTAALGLMVVEAVLNIRGRIS